MELDLSVKIGNKILKNPIGVASGTFGYASEFKSVCDLNKIGAIYTKAITLKPRTGNPTPRIAETEAGLLNAIGLANVGIKEFIENKLYYFDKIDSSVIVNVAGSSEEEYLQVVEELDKYDSIWGYEINLSCPNVKQGCLSLGTQEYAVGELTSKLKKITAKPIIIKLTPNVTDIVSIALAAEQNGADALSLINTVLGMAIDVNTGKFKLANKTGGLSGPAIKPIGVVATYKVTRMVKIPVIGMGGIMNSDDAIEYFLAGASAIQIGTGNFIYPNCANMVLDGLVDYMQKKQFKSIKDINCFLKDY